MSPSTSAATTLGCRFPGASALNQPHATTIELSPEANEAWNSMPPKLQHFCILYQRSGNASNAYRLAYDANDWNPHAVAVEASRLRNRPDVTLILGSVTESARNLLASEAIPSVLRLVNIASIADDPQGASASKLATAERAAGRLLLAAGFGGQQVTVNTAVQIDVMASDRWQQPGNDGLTGAQRWRARNSQRTDDSQTQ